MQKETVTLNKEFSHIKGMHSLLNCLRIIVLFILVVLTVFRMFTANKKIISMKKYDLHAVFPVYYACFLWLGCTFLFPLKLDAVAASVPSLSADSAHITSDYAQALPATDALGRKLPLQKEAGRVRNDKYVGLFYWTWHTDFAKVNSAWNLSTFFKTYPMALYDYKHPAWDSRPRNSYYFWGEPLFGYYIDTDEWVLYKHAEMLGEAGVDVVIFDCTNGSFTWKASYMKLCEVFTKARKRGITTPQIAFMMGFAPTPDTKKAIKEIYNDLYRPGLFRDLWFYWKGKPLIMAYPDNIDPEADEQEKEIRQFFTFRPGQPLYRGGPTRNDQWGWLEVYPQNGYVSDSNGNYEQVTVGVAQNWSAENGLSAMNAPNTFGRSHTVHFGQNDEEGAVDRGMNFQEQWERALEIDPEFIFITGWNEWVAGRFEEWQGHKNAFPDQFSQEKSRDIEPMKGGHGDNYYYQMVANIRRFKGVPADPLPMKPQKVVQGIDEEYWKSVQSHYRTYQNADARDCEGWLGCHYRNATGRNDFMMAKVVHDHRYICFYVECKEAISSSKDRCWMRLLIDADRNHATGWEGYDYVINRLSPTETKALLESNVDNKWKWQRKVEVDYWVEGNKMVLKVPKKAIGISDVFELEFKWSDNMQEEGDIMDFWVNGDVAPMGRYNYLYRGL